MKTLRLIVHGRVQGVGYRASFLNEARRLGLTGWVRNRRDGTVEAIVQGNDSDIATIVAWSKRGPSYAEVDDVEISDAVGAFTEFEVGATL